MRQPPLILGSLFCLAFLFDASYGKPDESMKGGLLRREVDQHQSVPETLVENLDRQEDAPKVPKKNVTSVTRPRRVDVGVLPTPDDPALQMLPAKEVTVLPAEPAPKSQRGLDGWTDIKTYRGLNGWTDAESKPYVPRLVSKTLERESYPERVKTNRIAQASKIPAFPRKLLRKFAKVDSLFRLPFQPSCKVLVGAKEGFSDHGRGEHTCKACADGCTKANKQRPINVRFNFLPSLAEKSASDVMLLIEFDSVDQVRPYSLNGVQHNTKFSIAKSAGSGSGDSKYCDDAAKASAMSANSFNGEMGPQAYGGSYEADAMNGQHVFLIMDTLLPAPDGSYVKGRWLALPGRKSAGHIGTCRRHCVHCDKYPELLQEGQSTGTICTAPVSIRNRQKFMYRLYQKTGTMKTEYDGAPYLGSEWEVQIQDPTTGASYPLGSIVLEGSSNQTGISDLSAEHRPVGCAPCDAFFHAVQTTGPFILSPRGKHELQHAVEETSPDSKDSTCDANRVISLGGYSLLYETGPGVKQAPRKKDASGKHSLFRCPVSQKI